MFAKFWGYSTILLRASLRRIQRRFLQAQKEQKFTTKFVKDMVLNLIIAGRDTTACLLRST